jgi:hypothetical protein
MDREISPGVRTVARVAELMTKNGGYLVRHMYENPPDCEITEENPWGIAGLKFEEAVLLSYMCGIIAGLEISGNGCFEDVTAEIEKERTRISGLRKAAVR